jgi:N-acetylneuraminic acid mutarotase
LVNDFWQYSPSTDTWTQLATYPGANGEGQFTFTLLGNGYAGMGTQLNGTAYANEFFKYTPSSNTWTSEAAFPGPLEQDALGFNIGENGYVLGGDAFNASGTTVVNYQGFYEYSAETASWSQLTSFYGPGRGGAKGFLLGDTLIVGLGETAFQADSALGDVWSSGNTLSGITNISANAGMIFPNPTSSKVTVSYTDAATVPASFRLYDMTGRQMNTVYTMGRGNTSIDLSGLSSGVYLLEAFDKNQISLWKNKIVKE